MGYELHITRADDWTQAESLPILLEEWRSYVDADPEMRMDNQAVATSRDQAVVSYENEGLAVWTAWSEHNVQGNMAWFDYNLGRIVVKNPDEEIVEKMRQIAAEFSANVIGDDGEPY